jgi:predicted  nucleic acid-binding Zn-ribbon protein
MATIKELEKQVNDLSTQLTQFQFSVEKQLNNFNDRLGSTQSSTSSLRDEVLILQKNYSTLVKEMSTRLEVIHNRFQSS